MQSCIIFEQSFSLMEYSVPTTVYIPYTYHFENDIIGPNDHFPNRL